MITMHKKPEEERMINMLSPGQKLNNYLKSLPIDSLAEAINIILGSLVAQCADNVARKALAEEGGGRYVGKEQT
jgi:hypothetical protein